MELDEIIEKLEIAFKRDDVKKAILDTEWLEKNTKSGIDTTGFCYAASEVIWKLTGGKEKWKLGQISGKKWKDGGHCYIIDKETDEILDITKSQYVLADIKIPYDLSNIGGGFRSKQKTLKAEKLAKMAGLGDIWRQKNAL